MRIAIIGSGISGLTAAYLLHKDHQIVVYEQNDYIGGHANTVDVEFQGDRYPIDTGFIVFNQKTYSNFTKLLKKLGVAWKDSNMSFGVHCDQTGLEYSPSSLGSLFAQYRNILRPPFWRMVWDIFRFRRNYESVLNGPVDITLMDLLERERYCRYFREYFIIPMGAAIWSADPKLFAQIPARFFVRFFQNHGFLNIRNQPQWLTIQDGSRQYVNALTAEFKNQFQLKCEVLSIRRLSKHVLIRTANETEESYDQVIVATHSDQALKLLSDPSKKEREILGAVPYKKNTAVLHTDINLLPRIKKTWASWNYRIPEEPQASVILTYNMNILQNIKAPATFCVTLNSEQAIDSKQILYEIEYAHPVFTNESMEAQRKHQEISGINRTHYCGAYWGNGFHEDGVNSALAVCRHFGKEL
ncbi:MAG: NAD(P)/FAD-dependent oxidoreductase [Candidatus Hodarchaeota archaeon]